MRGESKGVMFKDIQHRFKPYSPVLLKKIQEIIDKAEDPILQKILDNYIYSRLKELIEELEEKKRDYKKQPLRVRAEVDDLELAPWRRNEDGSMWTKGFNAPNLRKLLELRGGRAPVEDLNGGRYLAYLTRSGNIILYPRGGRRG